MNPQTCDTSASNGQRSSLGALQWGLLIVVVSAYLLLFWPSLSSMASIWWRSDTYAHGMMIPAISVWLIWRNRAHWQHLPLSSSWLACSALVIGGFVWLLGIAVGVSVLHQLAAVGILIVLVPALFGLQLFWKLLFALAYLLFMVPFGEELTPALQQVTADITVQALRLSGIPVYINGLFIETPTGRFEVAEACSGIRYLIASLAVGTLYAYLTYQSRLKRSLFIIASLLVPIIANGIRAYGIVLIAHLSEMKYATGIDHLIYGWLFFGLVMALLFWVGSFWRDPEPGIPNSRLFAHTDSAPTDRTQTSRGRVPVIVVILLLFAMLAMASAQLTHPTTGNSQLADYQINLPHEAIEQGQATQQQISDWQPDFIGADRTLLQFYHNNDATHDTTIGLYIADYQIEGDDKELINRMNRINSADLWTTHSQQQQQVAGMSVTVTELRHINGGKRQVWHWYQAYDQFSNNPISIKFWQALNRLSGSNYLGSVFAVAVDYGDATLQSPQQASQRLTLFMRNNWQTILDQHRSVGNDQESP